jgi:hypothetical protein
MKMSTIPIAHMYEFVCFNALFMFRSCFCFVCILNACFNFLADRVCTIGFSADGVETGNSDGVGTTTRENWIGTKVVAVDIVKYHVMHW